jgi:hypothetical protein
VFALAKAKTTPPNLYAGPGAEIAHASVPLRSAYPAPDDKKAPQPRQLEAARKADEKLENVAA